MDAVFWLGVAVGSVISCLIARAASGGSEGAWMWGVLGPIGWIVAGLVGAQDRLDALAVLVRNAGKADGGHGAPQESLREYAARKQRGETEPTRPPVTIRCGECDRLCSVAANETDPRCTHCRAPLGRVT